MESLSSSSPFSSASCRHLSGTFLDPDPQEPKVGRTVVLFGLSNQLVNYLDVYFLASYTCGLSSYMLVIEHSIVF